VRSLDKANAYIILTPPHTADCTLGYKDCHFTFSEKKVINSLEFHHVIRFVVGDLKANLRAPVLTQV
jgi:hypothetical protein